MKFGTPELRGKLKAHQKAHQKAAEQWRAAGYPPGTELPTFPDDCLGMRCGAKTRAGIPCKQLAIWNNGRCKFHGGMSTGPRTPEGKRRSAHNGNRPKRVFLHHGEANPMKG